MNIVTIRSLRSARRVVMAAATAAGLLGGPSSGLARDVCAGWGERGYFEAATIGDIRTCLTAGADPGARTKNGHTRLHSAAFSGHAAAIGALLAAGADLGARDKFLDYTPLHEAAREGHAAAIGALLDAGADPGARGKLLGNTPLHWKEIVSKARDALFSEDTPTVDILTDLRHFGGDTALVDFSRNLLVALFFACNGDQEEDGYVFVLPTTDKLGKIGSGGIHSDDRGSDAALVSAARTPQSRARVDAQSSVFVHVPGKEVEGLRTIRVSRAMKSACLDHLKRFHDIRQETMYNDLIGHIQNEQNFKTAETAFCRGLAKQDNKDHAGAIKDYDEAIRLRPESPNAFNNRGNAKLALGNMEDAHTDLETALALAREQDDGRVAALAADALGKLAGER